MIQNYITTRNYKRDLTPLRRSLWHKWTFGDWTPLDAGDAERLLCDYEIHAEVGFGKKLFTGSNGKDAAGNNPIWHVEHLSQGTHPFLRSRGYSLYLRRFGSRSIVRISDHWTATGDAAPRSRKMNCGAISTCVWSVPTARKEHLFNYKLDGFNSKYESRLLGEKISFDKFTWANFTDAEIRDQMLAEQERY